MKYQSKSFSVPVGQRKECESHWWDRRNYCVFCGRDRHGYLKLARQIEAEQTVAEKLGGVILQNFRCTVRELTEPTDG